jgi:Domain of unknown function (DUF3644)
VVDGLLKHIGWLYLLHAEFERDGISYYYRDPKTPRLYLRVGGEKKTWDLEECMKHRWVQPGHPVRANLDLTVQLRNRIEHRYEGALMVASAGFTQSLLLNYEDEIVDRFGPSYTVGDKVHIPVALSTFTREGVAQLLRVQQSLPRKLTDFFVGFRSGIGEDVANDRRFEFRVEIVQKRSPKTTADLAVSFVREDELTEEELHAYEDLEKTGRIILREKLRGIANLGNLRPMAVCERVEAGIPFRFSPWSEFPRAWKHYRVRPETGVRGKARSRTDERYCYFDDAHGDYVYTQAFADLIVEDCKTEEGFRRVIGIAPRPKASSRQ